MEGTIGPHDASRRAVFRYPLMRLVVTYLCFPRLSTASVALGIFVLKGDTFVGVFLLLFGSLMISLGAYGSLLCSSISIDGKGIAACNFGRTLRHIEWQNVTKITKVRRWNAGLRGYENEYYIFDGVFSPLMERLFNLRGPIAFSDKIKELRDLLDQINAAASQYQFSLTAVDQEAARTLAAEAGAGAWRRTVPTVDEVQVAEF